MHAHTHTLSAYMVTAYTHTHLAIIMNEVTYISQLVSDMHTSIYTMIRSVITYCTSMNIMNTATQVVQGQMVDMYGAKSVRVIPW